MGNIFSSPRKRFSDLESRYSLHGQYQMNVSSGATTVLAARTTTAGHVFSFRWGDATGYKAYIRYIGARFIATTAFTTPQEQGCDLIMARGYTASHGGGTAIDTGATLTGSGKLLTSQGTSLLTSCRVASTTALTAGTHTLDASPLSILSSWSAAIGDAVPLVTSAAGGGYGTLFSARDDESPIVLAQDEGFIIRNLILMGAVGVGRWDFRVEWDEGIPS